MTGSSDTDIRSQQSQQPVETIKSSGHSTHFIIYNLHLTLHVLKRKQRQSFSDCSILWFYIYVIHLRGLPLCPEPHTHVAGKPSPRTQPNHQLQMPKLRARAPGLCMPPIWCCAAERIMKARILGGQPRPARPCHMRRATCAMHA
jgi:hypothetical protein